MEHSHLTSYQICMDTVKIIAKEEHPTRRKIRENMEIEMNMDCLNKDGGKKLSNS